MLAIEFKKSNIYNEGTMENLDELHLEIEKRSNTNNTHLVVSNLWIVLAEQPLHIQFKLIQQGLEKHKPQKPNKNTKTKLKPLPQSHFEHATPSMPPKKPLNLLTWIFKLFL